MIFCTGIKEKAGFWWMWSGEICQTGQPLSVDQCRFHGMETRLLPTFSFCRKRGLQTRMVYLDYITCLRYTVLVRDPCRYPGIDWPKDITSLQFQFQLKIPFTAQTSPYTLCPISQQSSQGCLRQTDRIVEEFVCWLLA